MDRPSAARCRTASMSSGVAAVRSEDEDPAISGLHLKPPKADVVLRVTMVAPRRAGRKGAGQSAAQASTASRWGRVIARPPMSPPAKLLVVANRTADSDEVHAALVERAHDGPIDVTLVAPAAWEVVDPHGGRQSASRRLNAALTRLAAAGITARGVVGDADPVAAVQDIWDAERSD